MIIVKSRIFWLVCNSRKGTFSFSTSQSQLCSSMLVLFCHRNLTHTLSFTELHIFIYSETKYRTHILKSVQWNLHRADVCFSRHTYFFTLIHSSVLLFALYIRMCLYSYSDVLLFCLIIMVAGLICKQCGGAIRTNVHLYRYFS